MLTTASMRPKQTRACRRSSSSGAACGPRLLALGLGGGIVSLFSTLLALALLAAEAPAWLALLVFAAHIPWNLVLLVGVWRSTARAGVSREIAYGARLTILAWVVALSLL